jgi:peroxiredoxin
MLKHLIRKQLVFILLLILAVPVSANEGVFQDFKGNESRIDSFGGNGNWLVLMIWAHDCRICDQEVGSYEVFHHNSGDKNIRILGLSIDGESNKPKAVNFIDRHDLTFPNLIGELNEVMAYYRSKTRSMFVGTPSILLFDPSGEIKAVQVGPASPEAIEKFIAKQ